MTAEVSIRFEGVAKRFPARSRGEAPVSALEAVDLEIRRGEIFGVIGYSGAGKSTLVRLINALEKPSEGRVLVEGTDVTTLGERELTRLRLGIGMIFQQFNLFSSRNVWENIAYPLRLAKLGEAARNERVAELLRFVGLADKAAAYPEQLSGGQKQRVGIARALAARPGILLADEATSALDPETTLEVLELLQRVNRELGVTIVIITHEMEVIRRIADRVAVMEQGRIVESGEVYDVFTAPASAAAQRFVQTVVKAVPEGTELELLRERHPGRLVTLRFGEQSAQGEVFAELSRREVAFEIVYGGIDDIQGRSFGLLTLALRGADGAVEDAVRAIGAHADVTEAAR
ncbi:methionine ABC transporter ATP-binding protein [Homoserinibacter sp. YIM 151385]|uniref:methionine ABC transporter ATP-binding protein n=1 Tax=Homoserinibacter sp. YIM 151385 TaxID=2985506 RepID=UPI0022F124DC|nr:methionine ABC transporter ATP-binding protein [Homoserinibacter sp. YIM 151385]WBU37992.1 methionine ABC transporter ATP-binding protein [Homoserinibacter sp. YIM 151385]